MADIRVKLKLDDGTYYEVNKSNGLKNVESLSQSTGQPKEAYYGVIASRGNCELNDVNGDLLNMIKENKLPNANMEVKVFANGKQIQEHITTDSEYSNSQTLNLEMENWIYKLDNMMTTFYDGDYTSKTLRDIILLVINDLQTKLGKTILISSQLLSRATIGYQYICLPVMTYRSLVDKICYANRMNLIETDDGNLAFVDADTSRQSGAVYSITPDMVIGDIKRDVIVKNKVNKVNYSLANLTVYNHAVFETNEVSPSIDYSTTNMNISTLQTQRNADPSFSTGYRFDVFRGEFYVLNGSFSIPKSSNIKGIDTYNFTVEGEKKTTMTTPTNGYYGMDESQIQNKWSSSKSPIGEIGVTFSNSSTISSPLTSFTKVYTDYDGHSHSVYANASSSYMTMSQSSTAYVFNYTITIHQAVFHMRASHGFASGVLYETLDVSEGECRDINKITFNISGRKMVLELDNDTISYGETGSPNELTIPQSELITTTSIGDRIASNIISDYGDGVMTAQLTIACVNIGNKDFSKGEVLQVGDYVQINRDKLGNSKYVKNNGVPYVWKIVGRNFRYSGVPLIDLTLQELK